MEVAGPTGGTWVFFYNIFLKIEVNLWWLSLWFSSWIRPDWVLLHQPPNVWKINAMRHCHGLSGTRTRRRCIIKSATEAATVAFQRQREKIQKRNTTLELWPEAIFSPSGSFRSFFLKILTALRRTLISYCTLGNDLWFEIISAVFLSAG